ncbi:MAG: HAD family hydrolase [Pseudomonadota bacterium]
MRIAVWSGPRNLSTALMYAFGNRPDMQAVDEPFYGAFLNETGIDHPMAAEVLAKMELDPARVVAGLRRYPTPYQYEKHMAHHMVAGMPLGWLSDARLRHVVLLRHPARVLASYLAKREAPSAYDLGFQPIYDIYQRLDAPIVIDTGDIRRAPEPALRALCDALSLPFSDAMLAWGAGPKPFDGPWARHWYDAVHRSTGFAGPEGKLPDVPGEYGRMIAEAVEIYDALAQAKLPVS